MCYSEHQQPCSGWDFKRDSLSGFRERCARRQVDRAHLSCRHAGWSWGGSREACLERKTVKFMIYSPSCVLKPVYDFLCNTKADILKDVSVDLCPAMKEANVVGYQRS